MNPTTSSARHGMSLNDEAATICHELELCLDDNASGGSNPYALQKIEALCTKLKSASPAFSEKAGSLMRWAQILYSPRKHIRWATQCQSGAERVAYFLRCDLVSINIIRFRISKLSV